MPHNLEWISSREEGEPPFPAHEDIREDLNKHIIERRYQSNHLIESKKYNTEEMEVEITEKKRTTTSNQMKTCWKDKMD